MEELLEKARRDYPAGTVFKSAFNPDRKGKVTHLNFFVENENIFTDQLYDDLAEEGIGEAIYYEGKWAEIISNPKVKEDMNEFLGLPKEGRSIVTDPYGGGLAGTTPTTRTFGQIKEDDFFERAYTSICKMQQAKNKKYGESALSDKFNLFDGKTKLAPRLKDKLNRVDNSPVLIKNDISDLIGYLMLVCKENNWDNFEDLID